MSNSLTRNAGFKVGPIFLETLVRHYFDRLKRDAPKAVALRQDEFLYDEAFNIVKKFLQASTRHTVEELQAFSNTRTPSPPWVHVVRLRIPMSCCDDAAALMIKAFGGEEVMKRIVGGVKWWQVRGVKGVDAEWITARKDWQEAKKRAKEGRERTTSDAKTQSRFRAPFLQTPPSHRNTNKDEQPSESANATPSDKGKEKEKETDTPEDTGAYQPEMDEMRCILYSHGGGYYFGSVDQERYSIQRYARKIHGRVLAINYRLAPQYPFPCAIQDLLAAYLYLIRPPPDAAHTPVKPGHIIIAGDSAGGGLSLALLQVIRDTGLPPPAGAVLISPWCDFTHSFPSIYTNTDTDVIPSTGLSLHKPSPLWPPPSDEVIHSVRDRLRKTVREAIWPRLKHPRASKSDTDLAASHSNLPRASSSVPDVDLDLSSPAVISKSVPSADGPIEVGSTVDLPTPGSPGGSILLRTQSGESLEINQQIQLYAPNTLLKHPLVSPALSYLGGLPPLLVIASDKEVLRDEIIYAAHKAAYPEKFPIGEEAKRLYPCLEGIEQRYGPTPVHLQVYDDAAHVLPVLFAFTTPAKYCYRAIASFCKHVTNMLPTPQSPITAVPVFTFSPETLSLASHAEEGGDAPQPMNRASSLRLNVEIEASFSSSSSLSVKSDDSPLKRKSKTINSGSVRRSWSKRASLRTHSLLRSTRSEDGGDSAQRKGQQQHEKQRQDSGSNDSGDVAGPRFKEGSDPHAKGDILAGDPAVYDGTWGLSVTHQNMIRERVSTQGALRPLEAEGVLPALQLPPEVIGHLSERAVRRYVTGKAKLDKKFASTIKRIEKRRQHNLKIASKDAIDHISRLQHYLDKETEAEAEAGRAKGKQHTLREGLNASANWSLAWALDADERPPPSSIVARRDTEEAIQLARIVDRAVIAEESSFTANSLWSLVNNFLTVAPDKSKHEHHLFHHEGKSEGEGSGHPSPERKRRRDTFMPWLKHRKDRPAQGDRHAQDSEHRDESSDSMSASASASASAAA
ncbi:alpha/beta-hydrolase [Dentipellis sp. KUC8613]|nr:alpha/beta-hydrolase [Dentipellis sp. KUC8613]